jgi:hypothetical protein
MTVTENVRDYIATRIKMLGSALGRRTNQDLIDVFQRNLERFKIGELQKAFDKAESELEWFPSPRKMTEMAAGFRASPLWKYSYRDVKATDPETGAIVHAKLDPINGEVLYRAHDCPEGRPCLASYKLLCEPKRKTKTEARTSLGSQMVDKPTKWSRASQAGKCGATTREGNTCFSAASGDQNREGQKDASTNPGREQLAQVSLPVDLS